MSGTGAGTRHVRLERDGSVAWITLDRPERMNAFAGSMRDDLHDAVASAAADPAARAIVITGAGRAFCAGADVEVMERLLEAGDERGFARLVEAGMRVVLAVRAAPQPVIAALNGVAVGAGASLAAACDIRIASTDARIGFTFNRIGLHPDWGASYTLPRLVGAGRAAELILSARVLDAAGAAAIGLVDRVVDAESFTESVRAYAAELAARPPLALRAAKQSLARSLSSELQTMLDAESAAQVACFRSADVREGIAAFREKREPKFTGSETAAPGRADPGT